MDGEYGILINFEEPKECPQRKTILRMRKEINHGNFICSYKK